MARFMIKASEYKNVCKAVNDRKLAELKKEIIEILKKQDEKEVKKAIDYFNSQELHYTHLEKSFTGKWIEKAGYGIGTVRIWKGKKYKKIAPGKWARVFEKEGRGTNIAIGKLIAKVQKIDNVEDLMAFVMQNKQRFVDENGVDLPVLDKLRDAVDERNGNVGSKGTSKPAEKGNKKSGLSDDARIALLNLHDRNKDDAQSILSKYIKNTKDETQKRAYEEAYNYLSINDMPKFKDGKIVNEKPAEKKEDIWNKISDFSDSYGNKYKVAKKEDFSESEIKEIESKVKELSKDEKKYGKFVGIARDEKWNHPVAYFEHENGSFGGFTFNNIELKSEKKEDLDAALKEVEDAIDNAGDYDDVEELEKERKEILKKMGKKPAETSKQTDYYKDISEVLTKDEKRRINEKVEEYSKENEWSIPAADMKKFVKDWQSALKETDKHAKAEKLYEIYSKLEDANWHDENKKLLAGNFEYFNDKYFKDMYGEEPEEQPAEKEESENKTYWIQDSKGNRITSEDAKKTINERY